MSEDEGRDGLRVAYLMSRFPKLTETFVLYEMLALEAEGVDVEIFPLLRHRSRVRHPEAARLVEKAHYHPFLSLRVLAANLSFLWRDPRSYLSLWWEMLSGTWGSANFFAGALAFLPKGVYFARQIERLGVGHVHAHFANHPTLVALAIHRLTGIPYSFTAHGSDLHVERRMLPAKVRSAAFVVTVSEYNRELIVEDCGEDVRERVEVVHCGVDTATLDAAAEREVGRDENAGGAPGAGDHAGRGHSPENPLRIVCVAALHEVKGHRFLVEACRILERRGVDFRCELVGGGPEQRALHQAVEERGLTDRVKLRGPLPRPDVIRALGGADVAVLASHPTPSGKREGIPVALMEAMAMRLPVVASGVSGIPELVEHERTGILVPPGDPASIAAALERLAAEPELRQRMGAAGRERVTRSFELRETAGQILDLIHRSRGTDRRAAPPSSRCKPCLHADQAYVV